jgi:hypothetical protein
MRHIPVPPQPFQVMCIDTLGPYIETENGNRYVHTAVCLLSKMMFAEAAPENAGIVTAD